MRQHSQFALTIIGQLPVVVVLDKQMTAGIRLSPGLSLTDNNWNLARSLISEAVRGIKANARFLLKFSRC